ncbi:MAG: cell division ATP-binding protein FtsE [Rhodocyclaceae bacterium]
MIRFERVSKSYPGGIEALRDLSLHVAAGEMLLVTGRSGAGKSTVLKLIPAIELPSEGTVVVAGQNVARLRRAAIPFLRRRIGLVFQDHKLLFDRSVFDNVMLPLAITGFPARDAARRAEAALDKVGLAARARAMPVALSGGEQQRLAIARAIVHRPSLVVADEPTANLDAGYAREIACLLESFRQVGVTVVVATHDETVFADCAARRIVLERGTLAG